MVKNTFGGNKAKAFARKGNNNNKDTKIRVSENEYEMYFFHWLVFIFLLHE